MNAPLLTGIWIVRRDADGTTWYQGARFTPAADCQRAANAAMLDAYQGIWGLLGTAIVTAREKREREGAIP